MPKYRFANLAPSLFLVVAMVLGGASLAGDAANLLLQLLSLGIVCTLWALGPATRERTGAEAGLMWLFAAICALIVITLIPLPPALWSSLPGREGAVRGFDLLGVPLPWLPLSLSPASTLWSALSLLPVAAMAMVVRRSGTTSQRLLMASLLVMALGNALLGIFQFVTGIGSPLYLYAITNRGLAVGLFANANHLASLMALAIPVAASFFGSEGENGRQQRTRTRQQRLIILLTLDAIFLVACWMTDSMAGMALSLLGIGASPFLFRNIRLRPPLVWAAALLGIALIIAAFAFALTRPGWLGPIDAAPGTSRQEIYPRAMEIARDTMPVGTGLGSFARVYQSYEDPDVVTNVYANHAHNDLLELFVEWSFAGLAILLAVLVWTIIQARSLLDFSGRHAQSARAAMAAILIVALHSLIDYPLRTSAMAVVMAAMFATLARRDWLGIDADQN